MRPSLANQGCGSEQIAEGAVGLPATQGFILFAPSTIEDVF